VKNASEMEKHLSSIVILLLILSSVAVDAFNSDNNSEINPVQIAKNFLAKNCNSLFINCDLADIKYIRTIEGKAAYNVEFIQVKGDLEIFGTYINVIISKMDGAIQWTKLKYYSDEELFKSVDIEKFPLSIQQVKDLAIRKLDVKEFRDGYQLKDEYIKKILYFDEENKKFRTAYMIDIAAREPLGYWRVIIDAASGEMLKKFNLMRFQTAYISGSGYVWYPDPVTSSGNTNLRDQGDIDLQDLNNQRIQVSIKYIDPAYNGRLVGLYVDLCAPGMTGYLPACQAQSSNYQYYYSRSDDRFEEVMVYYHITRTAEYIQQLGYPVRNYIPAHAHYMPDANAFYDPYTGGIGFGDGYYNDPQNSPDFAEDARVIIHEYGHLMLDYQRPWILSEEGYAIHEGFADYLAASMYADVNKGFMRECISPWAGQAFNPNSPCFRTTVELLTYPDDYQPGGSPHRNGMIWSSALWELWNVLGKKITDDIILESHYYLSQYPTFIEAAQAIILADRNLYGGAHEDIIRDVFERKGILAPSATTPEKLGSKVTLRYATYYDAYTWYHTLDGTRVFGRYCDDCLSDSIYIGFRFPFKDSYKEYLKIDVNGYVTFDLTQTRSIYINTPLPSSEIPNDAIYVFWDDHVIDPTYSPASDVYIKYYLSETPKKFVITWYRVRKFGTSGPYYSFQLILYETGDIKMQYESLPLEGSKSATVGIEDNVGQYAKLFLYNYPILKERVAIRFASPIAGILNFDDYSKRMGSITMMQPSRIFYFPHFHQDSNWRTYISLINPSSTDTATVTLEAYSNTGSLLGKNTINIGPGRKVSGFVNQLISGATGTGWVKVSSNIPIVGLLNFDDYRNRMGSMSGVLPSTEIIFSNYEHVGNWRTYLYIINPNQYSVNVRIVAYGDAGNIQSERSYTISPLSKLGGFIPYLLGVTGSGWIYITGDAPIVGGMNIDDSANRMASVEPSIPSKILILPHFHQDSTWRTKICIVNTINLYDTRVEISAYSSSGNIIANREYNIAPKGRLCGTIDILLGITGTGYIVIQALDPVATVLFFDDRVNRMGGFPGITWSGKIYIPHFHMDSSWRSYIAVTNFGYQIKIVTINYISDSGSVIRKETIMVNALGKAGKFTMTGKGWIIIE
jgi:Zn-dependent metalloprotease